MSGKVKGHAETLLTCGNVSSVELVTLLHCAKPSVLKQIYTSVNKQICTSVNKQICTSVNKQICTSVKKQICTLVNK